jgi:phosphatidate cytidylyltransferase|tara:strand:+ start:2826 stop:3464 length:639 start_codon:yes stop_codon:yes gene_type:complete
MNEFKIRIFTSLPLLLILYFSLQNYLMLSIILFFIVFILLSEFNNIFLKIFKKKKLSHLILIFITTLYLFYFSLSILLFLNFDNSNKTILLFLLSISISTDIGGYCFGKFFKGKKLTKISPNKTYSGLIGSLLISVLVSFIFFRNLDLTINYLAITIILSIISQIGDLLISFLKRKAKIKDTGKFLPGHGGLLDRVDGILFAIPIGLIIISL